MRKTRRHKYLQLSIFFLIYSIIHVVSISNKETNQHENSKPSQGQTGVNPDPHDHVVENEITHGTSATDDSAKQSGKGPEKASVGQPQPTVKGSTERHHVLGNILNHFHGSFGSQNSTKEKNNTEHFFVADGVVNHVHGSFGSKNSTVDHDHVGQGKLPNTLGVAGGISTVVVTKQDNLKENITKVIAESPTNRSSTGNETKEECIQPAIIQFPHPIMSPSTRRHGGLIVHVLVAVYMFLGLAIVCDEYFVTSLDRICEELKMSPDVAGATFMAAGSSAPELATVIIGVFLAQDDIGISGVIGSAVFNIMFVISCCALCSSVVIYLNWWPLVRDCFFYAVSILVLLGVIYDETITWVESLILLFTYCIYCVVLHFNTRLETYAYTLPVPFRHTPPTEQSGLVSYKTLDDDGKLPNYGMDWSPDKQQQTQENGDQGLKNFGMEWSPEKHQQVFANQLSGPALNQATIETSPQHPAPPSKPVHQDYYKPKEFDPNTQVNHLVKPEGAGLYGQATWAIVYPIHWLCVMTMPDCRTEKYRNWYPFTFFVSMVWISFYSYFMVWMITLIGYTLYIPDTVMGLTFVAAGVSVPDALSSIAVIKEGYGDMAVSNAVGSNVFDILICLGLPWFIKTAIVNPGSKVKVKSKGLTYSTLSLLSTVVFLVVATHMNGWKLDRRYGIILMIWYLIFIAFASMYELNVFGPLNPETCALDDW